MLHKSYLCQNIEGSGRRARCISFLCPACWTPPTGKRHRVANAYLDSHLYSAMGELNWIESFVSNLNSVFLTQEHRCQHVAGESLQRVDFTTSLPLRLSAIFTSTRWQQRHRNRLQILQTLVSVCAGGIQFLHQTRQKRIIQLKHNIYLNSGALYYQ